MYRAMAFMFLGIFYYIYISKMIRQRKKGIKTDQMAKGGKKGRLFFTELILKISTYSVVVVEAISIYRAQSMLGMVCKLFGVIFCTVGDVIFGLAVYTMRDSWRAGIPSENDSTTTVMPEIKIIKNGIYKYSRNPAFLGFYFVYVGILLMYFNWVLFAFTILAMVMFHLQILEEEKFLPTVFGDEYLEYKKETRRYLGYGKFTWDKFRRFFYICVTIFSLIYYVICHIYVPIGLSLGFIWVLLAVFSLLRIFLLTRKINGKSKVPTWISVVYQIFAVAGIAIFLVVECIVAVSANVDAPDDLEYVIILGAGLNGDKPSRPLQQRINKAYEYSLINPDAVFIASGGQGQYETISEAEAIKRTLVNMGVDPDRIILENRSTSTDENIRFSYMILNELGDGDAKVGILTNGFHIFRAKTIAKYQGHDVDGVPATTLFPIGIHYTVREFFGLLFLFLTH